MTYTLHGRELKVGDKVWNVLDQKWITVNEVHSISHTFAFYAWDECTYQSTLGAIPPPLGWVEGKPVRKGDVLYSASGIEVAINEVHPSVSLDCLSWSPPKRTEQRWIVFNGRGVVIATTPTELDARGVAGPHDGHQVFGPFEVEVK